MRRHQAGFALLLMLFVLLSAGISGLQQIRSYRTVTTPGFTTDQYALQTARQALLAYTALYPWLYGPRGAGPGHLPCPDTDALTVAPWSPASTRDGPNPPCGSAAIAIGQLPRHVNLPGNRYVFHVESHQRLEYGVSTDMINNPVNRMVNDEVIRGDHGKFPVVAWIRQPLDGNGHSQATPARVPVTRESLMPGVRQSVAAWLVRQVNRERDAACSPLPEWFSVSTSLGATDVLSLIARREPEPVTQLSNQTVGVLESCLEYPPQDGVADDRLIEDVPLASHWFVRNAWHERIVLRASENCGAYAFSQCLLVTEPRRTSAARTDERLYFMWQVAS